MNKRLRRYRATKRSSVFAEGALVVCGLEDCLPPGQNTVDAPLAAWLLIFSKSIVVLFFLIRKGSNYRKGKAERSM